MALESEKRQALVAIIASHVPSTILADVVADHGIFQKYDELRKRASEDLAENATVVAEAVVDAYDKADRIRLLINGLSRALRGDDAFVAAIADYELLGMPAHDHHQAAIAKRANTLGSPALRRFLEKHESRICVVAGVADLGSGKVGFPMGTGFLVGPDLVITARHVLEYHIDHCKPTKPSPGPMWAFFDHLDGEPITDPRKKTIRARKVAFHPDDWLQACCETMPGEGRITAPTQMEIEELKSNVDMVLIKLAEPIGAFSRHVHGGARRGWVSVPSLNVPIALQVDDRIIIPQHPWGYPQQIDLGRFKGVDPSLTRIRYDTETEEGTSGAPCFNQDYELVGMHVAAYDPPGIPKLNQAIRFDHIASRIHAIVGAVPAVASRLWSVSEDNASPDVIVGRGRLLDWIKAASIDTPASRAERVYAADTELRYSGKSFSLKILKAALKAEQRTQSEQIVEMGNEQVGLPNSASDFLAEIAGQLKIPLGSMPPRPDISLPAGMGDGDKLNAWLSKTLPRWFDGVLAKQRSWTVDLRQEARDKIEHFKKLGLTPLSQHVEAAKSAEKIEETRSRWDRVWIVLDNVQIEAFAREVKELIAGLVGARSEEFAQHAELRRLRWLFLGKTPDFLDDVCSERLDQNNIPDEDIAECIRAFAASRAWDPSEMDIETAVVCVQARLLEVASEYNDPDTRLGVLQQTIGRAKYVFQVLEKKN